MKVLLILVGVFVALFGISNYIFAILESKGIRIKPAVRKFVGWVIFIIFSGVMVVITIQLLKNPAKVFVNIHWLWVLMLGIAFFLAFLIIGIRMCICSEIGEGFLLGALGICVLTLTFFGISSSSDVSYTISSADEFQILNNLPKSKEGYVINITNDIDFSGHVIDAPYGNNNTYHINGNGHNIKGIHYETTLNEEYSAFFGGKGKISNLKLVNCEYYLTPNYYSDEKHEGLGCAFNVLGRYELESVEVDVTIYKCHVEENALYESASYVALILPSLTVADEERIVGEDVENYYDTYIAGAVNTSNKFNISIK